MPQHNYSNLESALELRGKLWRQKKELEEEIKLLDESIRPALTDQGPVEAAGFRFECVLSPGRKTLDKKRLQADFPNLDLEQYQKVGAPFTTLKIKEL